MFEVREGTVHSKPARHSSKELVLNDGPRFWVRLGIGALLALALATPPGCVRPGGIPAPKPSVIREEPSIQEEYSTPAPARSGSSASYYDYLMAQRMVWDRNLDAAALYLGQAIEQDPQSLFLRQGLMEVLAEKGDYEEALEQSNQLLKQNPDNVQALMAHGSILFQQNEFAKAGEVYQKVLKLAPEETSAHFLLGETYLKSNQPGKAIAVYEDFLKRFPSSPSALNMWYIMGKTHFSQGNFAKAANAFEQTLALKPELTQVRLNLVEAYEELGNDKKVESLYRKMMEDTPSETVPYIGLGRYYLKKQKPEKALEVFARAREIHKQDPLLERSIAHAYLAFDYFSEAAAIFSVLSELNPRDGEILYFLGYALEGAGNEDQALEAYRKIPPESTYYAQALIYVAYMTKTPEDALNALTALKAATTGDHLETEYAIHAANLHQQAGNQELAAEILAKRVEDDPENLVLLFNLGIIYDKQNRKEECIDMMKRVVELKPDHADALNFLGYTYADLGIHLEEARDLIARALEISPKDGYIMDSMGWVHFKLGEYKKALGFLKKAVELAPDDPVIREHLGDAYMKTGNPKEALKAYKISLPGKIKRGDDTAELEEKIRALEN
ncbi:MAG: tetratricopeptide repeat protein [Desulfatibacillum sp.]|nr:tetratricopeptide repeat protein [Desulfatibacillum sp.]